MYQKICFKFGQVCLTLAATTRGAERTTWTKYLLLIKFKKMLIMLLEL